MGNLPQSSAETFARELLLMLKSSCGSKPLFSSQRMERRVARIPQSSKGHVYQESGPNPANENSAVEISYQVSVEYAVTVTQVIQTIATL